MHNDTLHDLTDRLNLADARSRYDRAELAGTDAALAAWAREWGRPAMDVCDEFIAADDDEVRSATIVKDVEAALTAAETALEVVVATSKRLAAEVDEAETALANIQDALVEA